MWLFDLDGTLSDSGGGILLCLNRALLAHGLDPIDPEDLWRHVGPPLETTVDELLTTRGADRRLIHPVIESYRDEYETVSVESAASYPGVPEMLSRLGSNACLGVVTSKPYRFAVPILDELGFAPALDVIEGPRNGEREEKTVTLVRALDRLGFSGDRMQITMVGDRRHDIEAGRAVGTGTIGVTWGFGTVEELTHAGADRVVDHPDEIGVTP